MPARRSPKPTDPRFVRTREQIRRAVQSILDDEGPAAVTFARVAQHASVNRSTVHQHYAGRQEMIADAHAARLAGVVETIRECPFAADDPEAPAELIEMFRRAARTVDLQQLPRAERALVAHELAERLLVQLLSAFDTGARPPGFDAVSPRSHADFLAGGLTRLLMDAHRPDPDSAADQAWRLIAPRRLEKPRRRET